MRNEPNGPWFHLFNAPIEPTLELGYLKQLNLLITDLVIQPPVWTMVFQSVKLR